MFKFTVLVLVLYINFIIPVNASPTNVQLINFPKNKIRTVVQTTISMPQRLVIPLREGYFHSFYTLQIYINHQGPFHFILDTGAEFNYISKKLAKKLNLKIEYTNITNTTTPVGNYNVEEHVYITDLVTSGALSIRKLPFFSSDTFDDEELEFVRNGLVGVIGLSTFNKLLLTLDLSNRQIVLAKSNSINRINGIGVKMVNYSPRIPVKIVTDSIFHADLIPDTGYSGQFHFNFCKRRTPRVNNQNKSKVQLVDLYKNRKQSYLTNLEGSVKFGRFSIQNPSLIYVQSECKDYELRSNKVGIMGLKILKRYKVTIDQKNSQILFIPN